MICRLKKIVLYHHLMAKERKKKKQHHQLRVQEIMAENKKNIVKIRSSQKTQKEL